MLKCSTLSFNKLFFQLVYFPQQTSKKDILVVQGDCNVKVGPNKYQQWARTAGRFGITETNDRMETPRVHKEPPAHHFQHSTSASYLAQQPDMTLMGGFTA